MNSEERRRDSFLSGFSLRGMPPYPSGTGRESIALPLWLCQSGRLRATLRPARRRLIAQAPRKHQAACRFCRDAGRWEARLVCGARPCINDLWQADERTAVRMRRSSLRGPGKMRRDISGLSEAWLAGWPTVDFALSRNAWREGSAVSGQARHPASVSSQVEPMP